MEVGHAEIGMIGCCCHDFDALEECIKQFRQKFSEGSDSHVLVCTCNRAELYVSGSDIENVIKSITEDFSSDMEQNLFTYSGKYCFWHLALVTAGLESSIISETEIQGQVKKAYEKACSERKLDRELHFIFQKALAIGKSVRSEFQLDKGLPDIEHIIFQLGNQHIDNIKDVNVLFIGATEFNSKIAKYFKYRGMNILGVCNRTVNRSEELATLHEMKVHDWENRHDWSFYHWIISAVNTEDDSFLFHKEMFKEPWKEQKIVFDLGLPRNIDPQLEGYYNVKIYDFKTLIEMVQKQRLVCLYDLEPIENAVKDKVLYYASKQGFF